MEQADEHTASSSKVLVDACAPQTQLARGGKRHAMLEATLSMRPAQRVKDLHLLAAVSDPWSSE